MRTITDELEDIILQSPFLEEGITTGVVNFSALARQLRPQIKAALLRDVSEAALVMALRRLSPGLAKRPGASKRLADYIRDLTVRSGLCAFTFVRTQSLIARQGRLLSKAADQPDAFVTFAQGAVEVTTIVDSKLSSTVERLFSDEKCLIRIDNLAAISVRIKPETVEAPGIYYSILKQLALNNINTVEVVSTYTELTIILEKINVDRAFSILFRAASRSS